MNPPSDPNQRNEILSSLNALVDISERWSIYLRRRQSQVRLARALLTGLLISSGLTAITIASIIELYPPTFFLQNKELVLTYIGFLFLIGLSGGIASYFVLWRRQDPRLTELAGLIAAMKSSNENQGTTQNALSFAEKILVLLPQVVRKREQDALLFGVVAFLVTAPLARLPVAIPVGVAVWLYFRFETNKTYERELSRFEEQRRIFEERKKEFIESL